MSIAIAATRNLANILDMWTIFEYILFVVKTYFVNPLKLVHINAENLHQTNMQICCFILDIRAIFG